MKTTNHHRCQTISTNIYFALLKRSRGSFIAQTYKRNCHVLCGTKFPFHVESPIDSHCCLALPCTLSVFPAPVFPCPQKSPALSWLVQMLAVSYNSCSPQNLSASQSLQTAPQLINTKQTEHTKITDAMITSKKLHHERLFYCKLYFHFLLTSRTMCPLTLCTDICGECCTTFCP